MAVARIALGALALIAAGAALGVPLTVDQRAALGTAALAVLLYLSRTRESPPGGPGGR